MSCCSMLYVGVYIYICIYIYGGFLKWWVSPTTIGFPTKNDHFRVFCVLGVPPPFKETPMYVYIYIHIKNRLCVYTHVLDSSMRYVYVDMYII